MKSFGEIAATESFSVGRVRHGSQDGPDVVAAESRRRDAQMRSCNQDGPESVLVAGGQEADCGRRCQRDLCLGAVLRSEVHGRGQVDHHPRFEVSIGDLVADVKLARARRDVPIDAPNIVARLIDTRFAGLAAVPGRDALMLAVQLTVEATIDGELE